MEFHELILLTCAAALGATLLFRFRPQDRHTLYSTLAVAGAGIVATGLAMVAQQGDLPTVARVLREAGVIAIGISIIRIAGMVLFRVVFPRVHIAPPRITEDILVVIGYVVWAFVRLRYAGVDFTGIVTASAVITAIIAFSMQDTLGNILGGIALQLDDSLQIGDWIKVDDLAGQVTEVRWRSTAVRTRNGETVIVPNSVLMKTRFLVLGKQETGPVQWRRWIRFDLAQHVNPTDIIESVQTAVRQATIANVAEIPPPDCLLMGFDGGNFQFAMRYWLTDMWRDDPTDSEVRRHIIAALRRGGHEIALPPMRIHAITTAGEAPEIADSREREQRMTVLRTVDLFRSLSHDELVVLAARLRPTPFAAGDVMTRQGNVSHWLYVITSGEAAVTLEVSEHERREMTRLHAGQFFGEMGLMTGSPRRATVVAMTDVECYRVDKQSFSDILLTRPEIVEDVSRVMAERLTQLDSVLQEWDEKTHHHNLEKNRTELSERIRRFFGIKPA